ncbi:MAG: GNAT family N-acetyltransferase [Bacteroidota bacterium]
MEFLCRFVHCWKHRLMMSMTDFSWEQFPELRLATAEDLPQLLTFFAQVRKGLEGAGIYQWGPAYPAAEQIRKDIAEQHVFCWGEKMVGTITLDQQQSSQYEAVQWQIIGRQIGVIHRLAVHPDYWGQGLAKKLCLFAEEWGRSQGWEAIRLDTYSENPASQRLYESLGYQRAEGSCYFHDNPAPFFLYEKRISDEFKPEHLGC